MYFGVLGGRSSVLYCCWCVADRASSDRITRQFCLVCKRMLAVQVVSSSPPYAWSCIIPVTEAENLSREVHKQLIWRNQHSAMYAFCCCSQFLCFCIVSFFVMYFRLVLSFLLFIFVLLCYCLLDILSFHCYVFVYFASLCPLFNCFALSFLVSWFLRFSLNFCLRSYHSVHLQPSQFCRKASALNKLRTLLSPSV